MDLKERLALAKANLSHVKTTVTLESGRRMVEDGGKVVEVSGKAECAGFVVDLKPDLQLCPVHPSVFIELGEKLFGGSQDVAADLELLLSRGVTGIVNAGIDIPAHFPDQFAYLLLQLLDEPDADLSQAAQDSWTFIRRQIEAGGSVLIHCNAGISRAPSVAIAFLMREEDRSLDDCLADIRQRRDVKPNAGFMRQLRSLEEKLNSTSS